MLNTESRLATLAVWLAVALICLQFLWAFFAWPPAHVLVRGALDSEAAAMAARNQTLLGAVLGLGGLALAYLLNGWRDRAQARHTAEQRERRLAGVLAREAAEIAATCESAGRQLSPGGGTAAGADLRAALAQSVAPAATLLLGGAVADIATLGAGAGAATRAARAAAARLSDALCAGRDDAQGLRAVAVGAIETAAAAADAARVFETIARRGPEAGDRLRLLPAPAAAEIEARLGPTSEAPPPSLLQPAA